MDGVGRDICQPFSPPTLHFLIGASYWLSPTGSQKAKKPIDAVLRDQPAQGEPELGRGGQRMDLLGRGNNCAQSVRLSGACTGVEPGFI